MRKIVWSTLGPLREILVGCTTDEGSGAKALQNLLDAWVEGGLEQGNDPNHFHQNSQNQAKNTKPWKKWAKTTSTWAKVAKGHLFKLVAGELPGSVEGRRQAKLLKFR